MPAGIRPRLTYCECSYAALPQCNASASGRSAQCVINPYYGNVYGNVYANAYADPVPRRYRRYRQVY